MCSAGTQESDVGRNWGKEGGWRSSALLLLLLLCPICQPPHQGLLQRALWGGRWGWPPAHPRPDVVALRHRRQQGKETRAAFTSPTPPKVQLPRDAGGFEVSGGPELLRHQGKDFRNSKLCAKEEKAASEHILTEADLGEHGQLSCTGHKYWRHHNHYLE